MRRTGNVLLLEVVLPGTPRFATGERARMVAFARMDPDMSSEVPARRESARARRADVSLLLAHC